MTEAVKKRIMFASVDDFYFLTYAILIALDALGCRKDRYLKDYRKLGFLIEFTTDERLLSILEYPTQKALNRVDREHLFKSYTSGLGRRSEVLKILFRLEKSGLVILRKGDAHSLVDVSLSSDVPDGFFDKAIFTQEYSNASRLSVAVKQLTRLTLSTALSKIYQVRGIKMWDI
ncbi:hypothetical protein F753_19385 [Stutzerimonas chloritidismutans AW-1]|uniref:Uncharacterized protein n=1 Tax=Stutzerimonas chloritidismutans AW-1 TaxID=1263865 RepID=V4RX90_STUCH|nr:hypothetical protein [Stutzerimonas chloritidismutans]ESQ97746.1 hypothetical protein F753_19385 [Stutzerimonas chloritidismutans AW-1]HBO2382215.1 hypothetical protein [Pseudomonas aeruginosa]